MRYLLTIFLLSFIPSIYKDNLDDVRKQYGIHTDPEQVEKEKKELELEEKEKINGKEPGEDKKEENKDDKKDDSSENKDGENKDDKSADDKKETKTDDKSEDTDTDEPVYRINKQEYKRSELLSKVQERYNFDVTTLDEDGQNQLIVDYVKATNIDNGEKIVNERHQENAKVSKQLKEKEEELNQREKDIDAKIKEKQALLRKDPEDEIDLKNKVKLELKQETATEELKDLEKQKESIQLEARSVLLENWYDSLINEFPHLKTDRHISDIVTEFNNGTNKDAEQTRIALNLVEVLQNYEVEYKSGKKFSIADFCRVKYPSLIASEKSTSTEKKDKDGDKDSKEKAKSKKTVIDLTALTSEERLKRLKERQNGSLHDPKNSLKDSTASDKQDEKPKITLKSIGYVR